MIGVYHCQEGYSVQKEGWLCDRINSFSGRLPEKQANQLLQSSYHYNCLSL